MKNIAILGFGVVGRGCADLLAQNAGEVARLAGEDVRIARILDLRDFPGTPYETLVTHDFADIENDARIDTVIETMGGSHPAYEYTLRALSAGKNVITSNKEVVSRFGDEFLRLAKERGVCYRFEAAVGGGIPVLSPLIGFLGQNRIDEVRGILNGTTNYILTEMFTYGTSFDAALENAQKLGYAERDPSADILGLDAARKLVILTALVTGKLFPVESIPTEGITAIRARDVANAGRLGCNIKLLGRCVIGEDGAVTAVVAPFMLPRDLPLSGTLGVYNAVEVVGEPIGNVMFYGRGAGAGATASAVIGDLVQVACSGRHAPHPSFTKTEEGLRDFDDFEAQNYIALEEKFREEVKAHFGAVQFLADEDECAFLTVKIREGDVRRILAEMNAEPLARIRLLK